MSETTGERICREMAEEWSHEYGQGYRIALGRQSYTRFFDELREKIDAAIKAERDKSLGEQVKQAIGDVARVWVINP